MTMFKIPNERFVQYRRRTMENPAINLSLVREIRFTTYEEYPDNEGIPSLTFVFSEGHAVVWVFSKGSDRAQQFLDLTGIEIAPKEQQKGD